MQNLSILIDFEASDNKRGIKRLMAAGLESYAVYTGGYFIFISNERKRAVCYTLQNFDTSHITPDAIKAWIGEIYKSYPGF
ncbi:MAG: hypothetical protein J0I84_13875 [Terrimonas sp.]|nr:hypothetical protein [Terrimonas sp.]OJY89403.1 MAG: hypothetical protein BGP13_02810 [Sphingobacteriales bacterium 40-81]